jgi:hypothetical protein
MLAQADVRAIVALAGGPQRMTLSDQALAMTSGLADRPFWGRARGMVPGRGEATG